MSSQTLSRYSFFALSAALFQFVPQYSVVLPSFLHSPLFTFFSFPRCLILLIISCEIHCFLRFLFTFPIKSLVVSITHFLILFQPTSTFPLSHSVAPRFSSSVSCTCYRWACNSSRSHLGFHFWNSFFLQSRPHFHFQPVVVRVNMCLMHFLHTVSE